MEGELVSRKRLEELAPEQFSSILILADEGATFATAGSVDAGADASADSDSRNLATLLLLRRACFGSSLQAVLRAWLPCNTVSAHARRLSRKGRFFG